ncbi:MAG: NAD(+)/NADH kinase [Actinomycetota bacterium]
MTVGSLALLAHHDRDDAELHMATVARWCADQRVEFWMPRSDAAEHDVNDWGSDRPVSDADVVVSLGGDGTMLRSVHAVGGADVPLLGVNLGSLGYLTEVEPDDLVEALDRYAAGPEGGRWRLDERMLLDVAVDGEVVGRALNEVVVEKHQSGHTVRLLARIDGAHFTTYEADGLIVATPTGSTAYSLSARGPIVSPQHRAILLTPVSPHMLFDRSLVLSPDEVVEIEIAGHRRAGVAIDGQPLHVLESGSVVRCTPSAATARFVRFGEARHHQVLTTKFGLADR